MEASTYAYGGVVLSVTDAEGVIVALELPTTPTATAVRRASRATRSFTPASIG